MYFRDFLYEFGRSLRRGANEFTTLFTTDEELWPVNKLLKMVNLTSSHLHVDNTPENHYGAWEWFIWHLVTLNYYTELFK